MNYTIRCCLFFLVWQCLYLPAFAQEGTYRNPVLPGFYPDPSVCRVGEDYYLVTSTFSYFPGIPLFHSKDLVHWNQLGHVLDRPEQLPLEDLGVSRGIFAPAISYNEGYFYVTTTLVGKGGNFIVRTTDPSGSWSDPYWLPEIKGIDPSLFFDDDGKCYIVYNSDAPDNKPVYEGHRTIRINEIDPESLKVIGDNTILVNGGVKFEDHPVWIEGPHIFKHNGYYYLIAAEGGTGPNHSEVVFRSSNVQGPYAPYKDNPILTQRDLPADREAPVSATGHAQIIETQHGEWWATFLATRPYDMKDSYNTGRETFLAPVKWENGWPVINPDFDEVQYSYPKPDLPAFGATDFPKNGDFALKDDFDSPDLPDYWMFLRTPSEKWYEQGNGTLRIKLRPVEATGKKNPSFLARRQQHIKGSVETEMSFVPQNENELAGIIAFQNEAHHYVFAKGMSENGSNMLKLLKAAADGTYELLKETDIKEGDRDKNIRLRITFDKGQYRFYYALADKDWKLFNKVDGTWLSTREAGGFVGVMLGPYTTSGNEESDNTAEYNWFLYEGNDQ